MLARRRLQAPRPRRPHETRAAVDALLVPPAAWKTCPWKPQALIETGLRQWLRCAGAAMEDGQVIGMPSRAVDEAWHGLILCTARYARFCDAAYGRLLHHHPEGDHVEGDPPRAAGPDPGSMEQQLGRTVVAWSMVADPGEACVLWDLDRRVGVEQPWGLDPAFVAEVTRALGRPPA